MRSAQQPQHSPPTPPEGEPIPHRGWVLVSLMLAMFMSAIEGTIVATAMPTIVAELGGFSLFSWVFSIYLLTSAVSIPIYGKLADMHGRKPIIFFGAGIFLIGSLLAGFSTSMVQLIFYRAVQGMGAGAVMPVAITIVGDVYQGDARAKVQGYIASVWAFSSIVGPALGALFVEQLDWAYVFWINLPVGAVSMIMLAIFLPEKVVRRKHQLDIKGALLLMVGTTALMLAMIQGATLPGMALAALLVLAAVCLPGFLAQERKAPEPMMPLTLWRHPMIATGNSASIVMGALMMGIISYLPAHIQGVMGQGPAIAGFTLAMMSIGWPLAATVSGRLMLRTSYRFTGIIGGVGLLVGSVVLMGINPARGPIWAGTGAFLLGMGMGFGTTTYIVAIQNSVRWAQRGVATSTSMFMRIVGQALGAAMFGAVVNWGLRQKSEETEVMGLLMEPVRRGTLDPERVKQLSEAMNWSMQNVYMITGALGLVVLLLATRIPAKLSPRNPGRILDDPGS